MRTVQVVRYYLRKVDWVRRRDSHFSATDMVVKRDIVVTVLYFYDNRNNICRSLVARR